MNERDEIWDEFKWEEFMKEQDKKVDRYMELFYRYQNHPDRDQIIAREMGWTWLLDEGRTQPPGGIEEEDEIEEGEDWKASARMAGEEFGEIDEYENLPVYRRCRDFALRAIKIVDALPDSVREVSAVVDFVSNATIAGAKLAGGSSFGGGMGDDADELGANIAYCKRALAASNLAIAALHEMKERRIIRGREFIEVMQEAVEVRNGIAVYILDLREKFRNSL